MINEIKPSTKAADYSGKRFAIVVSTYNEMVTGKLLEGAVETLQNHQIADERIDVLWVPGAWELAMGAKQAVNSGRYAGLVCLGAVIRGETTHDQHINRFVSMALGEMSLDSGLPIAFGLLTCNSFEQAHARAGGKVGNKGHEATMAMLEMLHLSEQLNHM